MNNPLNSWEIKAFGLSDLPLRNIGKTDNG